VYVTQGDACTNNRTQYALLHPSNELPQGPVSTTSTTMSRVKGQSTLSDENRAGEPSGVLRGLPIWQLERRGVSGPACVHVMKGH
jgi:hypothetical protein